jgi:hypothetical protein
MGENINETYLPDNAPIVDTEEVKYVLTTHQRSPEATMIDGNPIMSEASDDPSNKGGYIIDDVETVNDYTLVTEKPNPKLIGQFVK